MKLKQAALLSMASTLLLAPMAASAYEAGDIVVRGGITTVSPDSDGGNALDVHADDDTQLGITAAYFLTDNVAIELLASTPFSHDIKAGNAVIGETKHLPPTLSAQYYFNNESAFTPYVGAGLNYTIFFDEEVLGDKSVELKNSVGLAIEAGVDYAINENWGINASLWYVDIETEVEGGAADGLEVTIDPIVYNLGVAYKF